MRSKNSEISIYMRKQEKLLSDFEIAFTPKIQEELESLYPRKVAIENHIRKIILEKLEKIT